jgi:hypothetical protein
MIYKDDAVHVPELEYLVRRELAPGSPVHQFCSSQAFLARRDDRVVGRAVAIRNPRLDEKLGKGTGLIGYFECMKDAEIASVLFESCGRWCAERGARQMLGNVNFSFNYQVGVLSSGHDAPHTFLMPHHAPYYCSLFDQPGFRRVKRLHAYKVDLVGSPGAPPAVVTRAEELKREGFYVRRMRRSDVRRCLVDYNETWRVNYGHTPFTRCELDKAAFDIWCYMGLDFCYLAEKDGFLAGYLFTFPDINRHVRKWDGRIKLWGVADCVLENRIRHSVVGLKTAIIGVTSSFAGRQVSALLNSIMMKDALRYGCEYIERSWILEDNVASIRQATRLGGVLYKTYDIFGWDL